MDEWIFRVLFQPTAVVTERKERKYSLKLHPANQRPKTRISVNLELLKLQEKETGSKALLDSRKN